jgi:hypothetical protein
MTMSDLKRLTEWIDHLDTLGEFHTEDPIGDIEVRGYGVYLFHPTMAGREVAKKFIKNPKRFGLT